MNYILCKRESYLEKNWYCRWCPKTPVAQGQELLPISKWIERGDRRREEEIKKIKERRENEGDGTTVVFVGQLAITGGRCFKENMGEEARGGKKHEMGRLGLLGICFKGHFGYYRKKRSVLH